MTAPNYDYDPERTEQLMRETDELAAVVTTIAVATTNHNRPVRRNIGTNPPVTHALFRACHDSVGHVRSERVLGPCYTEHECATCGLVWREDSSD